MFFCEAIRLKKKKTVRAKIERLLALATGRKRALIFMQDNPDPDAIASALALVRLLKNCAKVNATITYSGVIGRAENQAMVEQLEIPLTPFKEIDLAAFDLTALVLASGAGFAARWPVSQPRPLTESIKRAIRTHPAFREATQVPNGERTKLIADWEQLQEPLLTAGKPEQEVQDVTLRFARAYAKKMDGKSRKTKVLVYVSPAEIAEAAEQLLKNWPDVSSADAKEAQKAEA